MARTRLVLAATLVVAIVILVGLTLRDRGGSGGSGGSGVSGGEAAAGTSPRDEPTSTSTTSTTTPHDPAKLFDPVKFTTIGGQISPKSVISTGNGLVFAQNMMYNHTVTVYDRDGKLLATIPDAVDLSAFGVDGHPGTSKGAPVEAAADHANRYVYASNYSMYGDNFLPEGSDECGGPRGISPSYTYRIDQKTLAIDAVAQVGEVPKYVAVTPDDKYVLVTNWCGYDLSVLTTDPFEQVMRIPLGRYPRGIVVTPDSRTAYVAVMGSSDIAKVDLTTFEVSWFRGVGSGPRHLVLSPDGTRLYATLNGEGRVAAIDTATGNVLQKVTTGKAPRSMAISPDGKALYVVNYESSNVSVLRADDLSVVKTLATCGNPIGITYEPTAHRVWAACYGGEIIVFDA